VLATSRFHAPGLIEASGLVPVGIVVSPPRWPLPYELAGNVNLLAPVGMRDLDRAEFELLYRERLDRLGVDRARTILAGFAAAFHVAGCVLLCFEDLAKAGEWCHRRTFSAWWEERTGQVVPELVPGQPRREYDFRRA